MLSKRDYFLMADVFRVFYLRGKGELYSRRGRLLIEMMNAFIVMLEADNPKFNRGYFMNYIKTGRCKPKSPSGEAQAIQ